MSEIKLTEDELKKIQELNQDFTKTKLELSLIHISEPTRPY